MSALNPIKGLLGCLGIACPFCLSLAVLPFGSLCEVFVPRRVERIRFCLHLDVAHDRNVCQSQETIGLFLSFLRVLKTERPSVAPVTDEVSAVSPLRLREPMACAFAAFVCQVTPSTPAVLFPLLDVTRATAIILAALLVTRRCCKAFLIILLLSLCLCDSPLQLAYPTSCLFEFLPRPGLRFG